MKLIRGNGCEGKGGRRQGELSDCDVSLTPSEEER